MSALTEELRNLLSSDLFEVIQRLAGGSSTVQQALEQLRRFAGDGAGALDPTLEAVLTDVGVDAGRIRDLVRRYEPWLDLLVGTFGDLGEPEPIVLSEGAQLGLGPANLELTGKGELEVDIDGEALDGHIEFDAAEKVLIRAGIEGTVGASAGGGAGGASFGLTGNGRAALNNFFLHDKQDRVLPALLSDIGDFDLPTTIDRATDLRVTSVLPDEPHKFMQGQWVELEADLQFAVHGSFTWSQSFLSAASAATGVAEIDDNVTFDAGAHLTADFSHSFSGLYDLLIYRSPSRQDRVRVELHRSRSLEQSLGLEVGAGVTIKGVDRAARSLLDGVLPRLDSFVAKVDEAAGTDVRKLLRGEIEGKIDSLFKKNEVVAEIDDFFKKIAGDAGLGEQLAGLVRDQVLELTDSQLDRLDQNLEAARKALKALVKRYRAIVADLEKGLQKAAELKVGISFAHSRQRAKGSKAFLVFEIDPAAQPDTYRAMLFGDLENAFALAREGGSGVELIDGLLESSGSLTVKSDINVSAFGFRFDHGSVLKQDWTSTVTANGDLTIGVSSSLEGQLGFGRTRTLTFLASSQVVAVLGEASSLDHVGSTHRVSLELAEGRKTKKAKVGKLEELLQQLGVLRPGESLATPVQAVTGGQLAGRFLATAVVSLGKTELDSLLDPAKDARRTFALAMHDVMRGELLAALDSGDGSTPLVLWPSVDHFFREEIAGDLHKLAHSSFVPVDSTGKRVHNWPAGATRKLWVLWTYVEAFDATLGELRALRGSLRGLDAKAVLREIRQRQKALLKASKPLVKGEVFASRVNYVFFKAIVDLVGAGTGLDPYVVVEATVGGEERRIVVG